MANRLCPLCKAVLSQITCPQCMPSVRTLQDLPKWANRGMGGAREIGKSMAADDDDDDRHDSDDDDEDDRPRKRRKRASTSSDAGVAAGAAAGAAGLGIGMILLIVGGLFACFICVPAILVALAFPAIQKVREAAVREQTKINIKQVGLAIHAYHDNIRHVPSPKMPVLPPDKVVGDLSWRVSILPFMEHANVFAQFDKTVAWDNAKNMSASNTNIRMYHAPTRSEIPSNQTPFQYFTGPETMFPQPTTRITLMDITDGTSNTFLFAEARDMAPWAKPADMEVTAKDIPLPNERFFVCMGDGTVRLVTRRNASDDVLRQLINPRDGKVVVGDWDR